MIAPQPQPQQPQPESSRAAPIPPWSRWYNAWDASLAMVLALTRPHLVGNTLRERYHRVRQRQRFWRQAQWVRAQAEAQRRRGGG